MGQSVMPAPFHPTVTFATAGESYATVYARQKISNVSDSLGRRIRGSLWIVIFLKPANPFDFRFFFDTTKFRQTACTKLRPQNNHSHSRLLAVQVTGRFGSRSGRWNGFEIGKLNATGYSKTEPRMDAIDKPDWTGRVLSGATVRSSGPDESLVAKRAVRIGAETRLLRAAASAKFHGYDPSKIRCWRVRETQDTSVSHRQKRLEPGAKDITSSQ